MQRIRIELSASTCRTCGPANKINQLLAFFEKVALPCADFVHKINLPSPWLNIDQVVSAAALVLSCHHQGLVLVPQ